MKKFIVFVVLVVLLISLNYNCNKYIPPLCKNETHIIVYDLRGDQYALIDNQTYDIVRTEKINIPDSLYIRSKCLSSNKENIILIANVAQPNNDLYCLQYNIESDTITNVFCTNINSSKPPRLHPIEESTGILMYTETSGMDIINYETGEVEFISDEVGYPKEIFKSKFDDIVIITNYYGSALGSYTDFSIYYDSNFYEPSAIVNINDCDSVNIKDISFSENGGRIFISYLLSDNKAIFQSAFFGSYNLSTLEKDSSYITLPWSTYPYQIAYNQKYKECYLTGFDERIYIVNTDTNHYVIEDTLELNGYSNTYSNFLIHPNKEILFVNSVYYNTINVIDIKNRAVIDTINVNFPLIMENINLGE